MQSLLVLALTSHALEGSPLGKRAWRTVREMIGQSGDPRKVLAWAEERLDPKDTATVRARLESLEAAEEYTATLESGGMGVVTEFDPQYPETWKSRLGDQSPPLLYTAGNTDLLNSPSVGVVGSRDVTEDEANFARLVAEEAVALGNAVVSGGARGVDQTSMSAAYAAEGNSIGILADSLEKTIKKRETAAALESDRVCLVSPFLPTAGFQVGNAMARNKLIYAHSICTVVVAVAEGTGGTWAGAVEALENSYCPVLVRAGPDAGSAQRRLISMGAFGVESRDDLVTRLSNPEESVLQGTLL